jgi:hypothetical protein
MSSCSHCKNWTNNLDDIRFGICPNRIIREGKYSTEQLQKHFKCLFYKRKKNV